MPTKAVLHLPIQGEHGDTGVRLMRGDGCSHIIRHVGDFEAELRHKEVFILVDIQIVRAVYMRPLGDILAR